MADDRGVGELTVDQERHLSSIKSAFCNLVDDKYRAGAKEHGGNLSDVSTLTLVDHAISEAIDQVTYLLTLKQKLGG